MKNSIKEIIAKISAATSLFLFRIFIYHS
jgi:hypothetical protein